MPSKNKTMSSKNKTMSSKHKTIKRKKTPKTMYSKTQTSDIVHTFIEMLNVVKMYHWKTHSFSQHKATDELYSSLNGHIDTFVETLLGKDGSRIEHWNKKIEIMQADNAAQFKSRVNEYRDFLIDLTNHFDANKDSDLLNIRDEILGDINQFLYLLTFNR